MRFIATFMYGYLAALLVTLYWTGVDRERDKQPPAHVTLPHRPKAQSWDQENLHSLSNKPCAAVYDAPDGNLRMCL